MNIRTVLMTMALSTAAVVNINAQEKIKSVKELAFTAAYRERDSAKAIELGEKFLKDYPMATADRKSDKAAYIDYFRIYLNLITKPSAIMDEKIRQYYNEMPYITVIELYYRQVFLLNLHKIKTPEQLIERSDLLLKKMASYQKERPAEYADLSDEEWHKMYDKTYYGNMLTHVNILLKAGRIKEGMPFADEAVSHFGYVITSLNEDYVLLLDASGRKDKVQKVLEASVNANQVSPLMLDMLKKNYLATHKDDKEYDAYVESLKSQEGKVALEKELEASMIKKQIPSFALYDGNGKLVSTKDWKGKIVVLDFFASWCVPCKAAFPGMKMAQEKFAGDKDVVFYFIDNQEHSKDYKVQVLKYIKEKDFPFNILFDNEGEKGSNDQVAKLLGVSGIPRKMILDKNGVVRFDMDGYYGSPSKLADEIKIMVNLAKKAS